MIMSGSAATSTASTRPSRAWAASTVITFTVPELNGVEDYPNLFAELIRRGWSDANLAKLAGGNFLRAIKRAEAVSASMRDAPAALDKLPPAP